MYEVSEVRGTKNLIKIFFIRAMQEKDETLSLIHSFIRTDGKVS